MSYTPRKPPVKQDRDRRAPRMQTLRIQDAPPRASLQFNLLELIFVYMVGIVSGAVLLNGSGVNW